MNLLLHFIKLAPTTRRILPWAATALASLLLIPSAPAEDIPTCQTGPAICTREYNPTRCTYAAEGIDFPLSARGGNPCMARLALKKMLCQTGFLEVDSRDIRCVSEFFPDDIPAAGELFNTCTDYLRPCHRDYRPSICHYGRHEKAYGINRCLARNNLLKKLCDKCVERAARRILWCEDAPRRMPR